MAAFIVLIVAAIKKFVDTVARDQEEYNALVSEIAELKKEIEASDEDASIKQQALTELKARHETWKEWFSGHKAAEEAAMEEQLKTSAEEVAELKSSLDLKQKILAAAQARMIDYNDPAWSVD